MTSPKLPPIAAADIKAGPEIIRDFQRARRAEGQIWADGCYTQTQLDAAQETFGLTFPPDLIDLFLDRRPVQGWEW